MATLSYTIPDEKLAEYVSDYVYVHKNEETIADPEWVDPGDGSTAPKIAKYTDVQWVREHILRMIRQQIIRGKNKKIKDNEAILNIDDVV